MASILKGLGWFTLLVVVIGIFIPLGSAWTGYALFKAGGAIITLYEWLMPLFPPPPHKWV